MQLERLAQHTAVRLDGERYEGATSSVRGDVLCADVGR